MKIRLYCPDLKAYLAGESFPLEAAHHHYLHKVLRVRAGRSVYLFNEKDGEWHCSIDKIDARQCHVIAHEKTHTAQIIHPLVLYFVPIKKSRLGSIFTMATELGVTRFQPITSRHCHAKLPSYKRITAQLTEATEQCERFDVPQILPSIDWRQAMATISDNPLPCFAAVERFLEHTEAAQDRRLGILLDTVDTACGAAFVVGPEGGWSNEEIRDLHNVALCCSLGQRILRSETAVAALLAQFHAHTT